MIAAGCCGRRKTASVRLTSRTFATLDSATERTDPEDQDLHFIGARFKEDAAIRRRCSVATVMILIHRVRERRSRRELPSPEIPGTVLTASTVGLRAGCR